MSKILGQKVSNVLFLNCNGNAGAAPASRNHDLNVLALFIHTVV